ncbi:MAG: hypothetical protein RLZZ331_1447 [Pseudomonadota bacterium]
MELSIDIRSLAEFRAALDNHHDLLAADAVNRLGARILATGCREPLTDRRILPFELEPGSGWREGLASGGLSSRVRGVMRCMEKVIVDQALTSPRIYAAEGLTAFALTMRGLYPRFLGSEFTTSPERMQWMYPIPCEDLQALSMPDDSFDLVSTNEVLEHVPDIDKALKEMHRVLKSGGWHFGTVPFLFFEETGQVRATLDAQGGLIHHMEPQYHGDPMNEGGVLVFELPGWDLITRARAAGFRDAFMRCMISAEHGVLSEHIGGVLIFCCQK